MERCRSCNAPIEWVRMKSGRPNPVDPVWLTVDPNAQVGEQKLIVCDDGTTARGVAVATSAEIPPNVKDLVAEGYRVGRVSHFATCPNARSHRRA
jgi:hypothetical protein